MTRADKTTPFAKRDVPEAAMFATYKTARKRRPPWAAPLLASMAVGHVALFATMWAKSIWEIELLEKRRQGNNHSQRGCGAVAAAATFTGLRVFQASARTASK